VLGLRCRPDPVDQALTQRVKSGRYSDRLGRRWAVDGHGHVASWFRDVRALRNRVVHGGHSPTESETDAALHAAYGLVAFFQERLRDRIARYPRTLWMSGGHLITPARQLDRHVRPLQADAGELDWRETARRWQDVMRNAGAEGIWATSDPTDEARDLLAVKHASGRLEWVVVAWASNRACRVQLPPDFAPPEVLKSVESIKVPTDLEAVSIHIGAPKIPHVNGPWIAAYRLVPLRPVMVTGEALDPPN